MELKIYYSATGNNQFIEAPMRIARKNYCDFLNTDYKRFVMKSLQKYSDLPYGNDDLCPKWEKVF